MELNVTPADSLRLCKAMGDFNNGVKHCLEPGMQADQWGEAGRMADGVRSNGTLDLASCAFNFLCMLLLPMGDHMRLKKSGECPRQIL